MHRPASTQGIHEGRVEELFLVGLVAERFLPEDLFIGAAYFNGVRWLERSEERIAIV